MINISPDVTLGSVLGQALGQGLGQGMMSGYNQSILNQVMSNLSIDETKPLNDQLMSIIGQTAKLPQEMRQTVLSAHMDTMKQRKAEQQEKAKLDLFGQIADIEGFDQMSLNDKVKAVMSAGKDRGASAEDAMAAIKLYEGKAVENLQLEVDMYDGQMQQLSQRLKALEGQRDTTGKLLNPKEYQDTLDEMQDLQAKKDKAIQKYLNRGKKSPFGKISEDEFADQVFKIIDSMGLPDDLSKMSEAQKREFEDDLFESINYESMTPEQKKAVQKELKRMKYTMLNRKQPLTKNEVEGDDTLETIDRLLGDVKSNIESRRPSK